MVKLTLFALSIFLLTCKLNAQNTTPDTAISSINVVDNNVSGGGFQSDVTITDNGQTVYSSADVLYAGTGDKGGSGGLFRSVDGGDTWTITEAGESAQFSGNHSGNPSILNSGHPRSNGDLIVVDIGADSTTFTDDVVIAGTYNTGVKIFSAGGNILESTVKGSAFVRSVAYNPAVPKKAYAAIQFTDSSKNGIYKINFSNLSDVTFYKVYGTLRPEGLTALSNGNVYAVIGEAGIVRYTNGGSWELVNNNDLSIDNIHRQWTAVKGYVVDGNDVVYAGTNNQPRNGISPPNYSNIWRTVDDGQNWNPLIEADTNVSDQVYGKSYNWWYRTNAFGEAGLGRRNSIVSSIDVARGPLPNVVSDDIIYVSGRGGIWKSENGGDYWQPAVYNMQATANEGVAVNPNNSNQVALANTDYVVLATRKGFEDSDIYRDKPSDAESRAYDIIFDAIADQLIIGVGKRDDNEDGGGEVYTKSTNDFGDDAVDWTTTGLMDETSTNNGRVRAVTYGYHDGDSDTSQIILAAVEGEGVFRYQDGNWEKSTIWSEGEDIDLGTTHRSNFVWPDSGNSGVVYLLDLSIGLYRSKDGGENWINIWPCMSFNNNNFYNTGYITADNNDRTIVYLSVQGNDSGFGVYRMIGADTGVFGASNPSPDPDECTGNPTEVAGITDISTFHSGDSLIKRPGPIVFGPDGKLWLTQQQNSKNSIYAGLFVMENPTTDMSFTNVTTNEYRNIAIQPSGIDVSNDGHIYISQNGTGLVKIKYIDTENMGLSNSSIKIYPDPTSNLYTISGSLALYNIDILDANDTVYSSINNNGTSVSIDLSDLPEGLFFVRVSDPNNDQMYVKRILKF